MSEQPHPYQMLIDANHALVGSLRQAVSLAQKQQRNIEEQDKLIDNLIEENDRLKPKPKKMTTVLKSRLGKNPSWRNSAWLGLREGIWMAPSVWFKHLKDPITMLAVGAVLLIGKLLLCPIGVLVTTGLGLCGRLVEKEEIERR